jgi:DNA transformation protein
MTIAGRAERADAGLVEHVRDLLEPLGKVTVKRFFGGHAFTLGGAQFAMLIDGVAYLRADAELAKELESLGSLAFRYQTKQREVRVGAYWSVPDSGLDDSDSLVAWARRALAAAPRKKR